MGQHRKYSAAWVPSAGQVDVGKGEQVRASAERGRILLVLLLALLAMAGATAPDAAAGDAAQSRVAALGVLAPDTPATPHDLRDWLRLPVAARQVLAAPASDNWWAVCPQTARAWAPRSRSLAGEIAGTAVAIGVAAAPSTRAPPVRVS
jgi:hypothetical protein